ncbi:MAG: hypothetical protein AABZ74_07315 [Cyanobacteriota bacterium]
MSGISNIRVSASDVFYNVGTSKRSEQKDSINFRAEALEPKNYQSYRKEGFSKEQILDVLTQLNVKDEEPLLERKIDLLETKFMISEAKELSETLKIHFPKSSEHLQALTSMFEKGFEDKQGEFLDTILKTPTPTPNKKALVFNTETQFNQLDTSFEDIQSKHGISDESLLRVTTIEPINNSKVRISTQTSDALEETPTKGLDSKEKYSFKNTYSPEEWGMEFNVNRDERTPKASEIAFFQKDIAEKVLSKPMSSPTSIVRDTVRNEETISSMNEWHTKNLSSPSKAPTTMKKISELKEDKTRDKFVGLSEIENFLLNTANGGTTRKMLEKLENVDKIELEHKKNPGAVPYKKDDKFTIKITYKDGTSSLLVPPLTVTQKTGTPSISQRVGRAGQTSFQQSPRTGSPSVSQGAGRTGQTSFQQSQRSGSPSVSHRVDRTEEPSLPKSISNLLDRSEKSKAYFDQIMQHPETDKQAFIAKIQSLDNDDMLKAIFFKYKSIR